MFSELNAHEQLPEKMHVLAFDYNKLQNDVIEEFILRKSKIKDDIKVIRIPFKFRKPKAVAVGIGISKADVDSLSSSLGEEFKVHVLYYCTRRMICLYDHSV